jgi:hypothetical protein
MKPKESPLTLEKLRKAKAILNAQPIPQNKRIWLKDGMTPVEQAAAVYQREPCARSFVEDVELHLMHGFVFNTPDWFMLARPVWHKAPQELIVDPNYNDFPILNCWHCYLFAGKDIYWAAYKAQQIAGPVMEWVSFERRNKLRIHRMIDLMARLP